jgi:hypothetical protein
MAMERETGLSSLVPSATSNSYTASRNQSKSPWVLQREWCVLTSVDPRSPHPNTCPGDSNPDDRHLTEAKGFGKSGDD